jgi:hypothetical protein
MRGLSAQPDSLAPFSLSLPLLPLHPTSSNFALHNMSYEYKPLRSDSLRLLRPISIGKDSLAFEISHHLRKAAPAYTAVSYTWGDGAPTERIILGGKTFLTRVNLWSCLYYLGKAAKSECVPWRYLWVDAICIDQNNDQERNSQVRVMDQTYRDALVVSVWLGLPPIPDDMEFYPDHNHAQIRTFDIRGLDWYDHMEDLANRPYWTRFWVIQECLLAQQVHVYCGDSGVDWEVFKELLGHVTGVDRYLEEDVDTTESTFGSWAAWPLVTGRHPDKHPELAQSLYKLLVSHGKSRCKDPRDRVFALLGLVTLDERTLLLRFFPDYDMGIDDVVLIALCHVQTRVVVEDEVDVKRFLLALGVTESDRQERILRRSQTFDYFDDIAPSAYEDVFNEQELEEHAPVLWPALLRAGYNDHDIRAYGMAPDTVAGRRRSRCGKYVYFIIGLLCLGVLWALKPQLLPLVFGS